MMKKNLLLILVLFTTVHPLYGSENMSVEDGHAAVVGVVGTVTTVASLICWYFHQKILKENFAKKASESSHQIDHLQAMLGLVLVPSPNIVRVSGPGRPARPLSPRAHAQLFADDGAVLGRQVQPHSSQGSLPRYSSRPPSYHEPEPLYLEEVLPEDMPPLQRRVQVRQVLVGSLSPSPASPTLQENGFQGDEEA